VQEDDDRRGAARRTDPLVLDLDGAAAPVEPETTAVLPEGPMATPIPLAVSSVSPALTMAESSSSDGAVGPALGAAAVLILLTGVAVTGWLWWLARAERPGATS
jgi:hypothetical protein